jgi:hypothetical protein
MRIGILASESNRSRRGALGSIGIVNCTDYRSPVFLNVIDEPLIHLLKAVDGLASWLHGKARDQPALAMHHQEELVR